MDKVLLALSASELRVTQRARHPCVTREFRSGCRSMQVPTRFAASAPASEPARLVGRPSFNAEIIVAKPNYHQARKQKELARKARQLEKQQRRSARTSVADAGSEVEPLENPASTPGTPVPGGG